MDKRLLTVVTYAIVGVWVLMVVFTMIDRTYTVPAYVQALLAALAGYFFTRKNLKNGDK